eukprot:2797699-Rhodomonas_salina.2
MAKEAAGGWGREKALGESGMGARGDVGGAIGCGVMGGGACAAGTPCGVCGSEMGAVCSGLFSRSLPHTWHGVQHVCSGTGG